MDKAEETARAMLESMGYKNIVFEPDGNVPPDFLIDNRIAVEVRRLNQQDNTGAKTKGLEETAIPLSHRISSLLKTLGPPIGDHSWFVMYRFKRPIEKWSTLAPKMELFLRSIREGSNQRSINFGNDFEINVVRASKRFESCFVLGSISDWDSGGWVLEELKKSLDHCIPEKSKKVATYRDKYDEWWLVFIDLVAYGLDEFDRGQFNESIGVSHDFDRVILVDPTNPERIFDVKSAD